MRTINYCFCSFALITPLFAQSNGLSLDSAIAWSLANHPQEQLGRLQVQQGRNDLTLGNAGYMPQVNLFATANLYDSTLVKSPGDYRDVIAGAQLTWTLFQGFYSPNTYHKLDLQKQNTEVSFQNTRSQLAWQTAQAWLNFYLSQNLVNNDKSALEFSARRLEIAKASYNAGSLAQQDLNLAQQDFFSKQSDLSSAQSARHQARLQLEEWLNHSISDSIVLENHLEDLQSIDKLADQLDAQNQALQSARINQEIASTQIEIARASYWPSLQLQLSYTVKADGIPPSSVLSKTATGPAATLQATWNVFNGFETDRQVKDAQIQRKEAELLLKQTQRDLHLQLNQAIALQEDSHARIKLQTDNLKLARDNLNLALALFERGKTNSNDLITAQSAEQIASITLLNTQADYYKSLLQIRMLCSIDSTKIDDK